MNELISTGLIIVSITMMVARICYYIMFNSRPKLLDWTKFLLISIFFDHKIMTSHPRIIFALRALITLSTSFYVYILFDFFTSN